jgi:tellurite methyltransferase
MEERPWVQTEAGRNEMLGQTLQCLYCNMPALPDDAEVYNTSKEFTELTIPEGMLQDHRTRAGTWGRIVVREGKLMYSLSEPKKSAWILRPGIDGIIAPGLAHWIAPHGQVRFVVEFLRAPAPPSDDPDVE